MGLGTADHIIEEMFLSPRVVDAATFTELAEALRSLVRRAAEQRAQLLEAADKAAGDRELIEESLARLQAHVGPAARLVPTLDARIEKARLAAERLVDPEALIGPAMAAVTEAATARCESAVREQTSLLEARRGQFDRECAGVVDAQVDRLEMMVAELEERAAQAEQRLTAAENVLASGVRAAEASAEAMVARAVKARVDEALQTAVKESLEPLVEAAQSRVSQCIEDGLNAIASATRKAKDITADCERAAASFDELTEKAGLGVRARVSEEVANLERQVQAFQRDLRAELARQQAEASRLIEESHASMLSKLNDTGERSSHVCERVDDSLVGLEARAGSIAERLARRIDELAADADTLTQDTKRRVEAANGSTTDDSSNSVTSRPKSKATPKKAPARKARSTSPTGRGASQAN